MTVLYSTHCPQCKAAELHLQKAQITYVENNDVETMIAKGYTTAPVLEVEGVPYSGLKAIMTWIRERR